MSTGYCVNMQIGRAFMLRNSTHLMIVVIAIVSCYIIRLFTISLKRTGISMSRPMPLTRCRGKVKYGFLTSFNENKTFIAFEQYRA